MSRKWMLILLGLTAAGVFAVTPFAGMNWYSPRVLLDSADQGPARIFWTLRLPRTALAFLTGATLSLCGMVFQAMFRNPLATPYTLGVSSGASLGAVLYLALGAGFTAFGISGLTLAAFAGASLSIFTVFFLTRRNGGFSSSVMLLAGVALNFFFSSVILFLQYISDFTGSIRIIRWLMGSLQTVGSQSLVHLTPFAAVAMLVILRYARTLNLLAVDEAFAVSRGVNVKLVKPLLFLATSLAVGAVVAQCGPIGFIGMIAPHICRLIFGPDHSWLAPASLFFGGVFLTSCDLLSRTLIAPAEIPVGVITALLGGPFFLWLLLKKRLGESL